MLLVNLQVGLLEKSQDMYARAYDIQSTKLGPEHPDVAHTMNHTAGLLKVMGKYGDAESVYRAVSLLCCVSQSDSFPAATMDSSRNLAYSGGVNDTDSCDDPLFDAWEEGDM
jgi:hypothetical protein